MSAGRFSGLIACVAFSNHLQFEMHDFEWESRTGTLQSPMNRPKTDLLSSEQLCGKNEAYSIEIKYEKKNFLLQEIYYNFKCENNLFI